MDMLIILQDEFTQARHGGGYTRNNLEIGLSKKFGSLNFMVNSSNLKIILREVITVIPQQIFTKLTLD